MCEFVQKSRRWRSLQFTPRNTRPQNTHQFACAQQIRVQSVAGRGVENFDQLAFPLPHIQQLETELSLFSKCLLDGKAYEWLSVLAPSMERA